MKVLIVASGNANKINPFIMDQVKSLKKNGVEIDFFLIKGKGILGYLRNYRTLMNKVKEYKPEVIHAHYGLSGLLSSLQRIRPVVTTFHGSDINNIMSRPFSQLANVLSKKSIFVSKGLSNKLKEKNPIIIPCGVDLDIFYPREKKSTRKKLEMSLDKKYILFSSAFNRSVKNYPLAAEAISRLESDNIELLELKGYSREEVALLMNAVDLVLMTSFTEGSPQFIKEAMSCNTPIVSVDVGDVEDIIGRTKGCYLSTRDSEDIANKIRKAIEFNSKTDGRNKVINLDNRIIACEIQDVYQSILNKDLKVNY